MQQVVYLEYKHQKYSGVLLVGNALCVANAEQSKLGAIDANQTASTCGDLVIDARTLVLGYL